MSATPGLQSEDAQSAALAGVGVFMQQDASDSRYVCDHKQQQHLLGVLCISLRCQTSACWILAIHDAAAESS